MFYHPHDSKSIALFKRLMFWIALIAMFIMFIFLATDDTKISQKEIILEIDIKNRVNVCLPEDENFLQKEF